MATDDSDFRIRPGRSRSRGTRVNPRTQSFLTQVKVAVHRAGGNPNRISGSAGGREGKISGRFNARGRGAKVVVSFASSGGGWSRDRSGVRFRSRRVVVKARAQSPETLLDEYAADVLVTRGARQLILSECHSETLVFSPNDTTVLIIDAL